MSGHLAVDLACSGLGFLRLIDDDQMLPGNVVRHAAGHHSVGIPKVIAVQHLIEDLLTLERTELDRGRLGSEVDVRDLVEQVLGQLQVHLAGRDLTTTTEVSADLPRLVGDQMQLERALLNLLVNAVKFTPDGGGVHLSVDAISTGMTFTVSDTGVGIDESDQESVFDPFFRSHVAHDNAVQGSGIGLAVVHRIVEAHGGEIALTSTLGEGTTVSLTLPVPAPGSSGQPIGA